MRPGTGDHLHRDIGPPRHPGEVGKLVTHDLRAADLTVQYVLIEQHPEQRRVIAVKHSLAGEPSRYPLSHLLGGRVRVALENSPRVILRLQ